MSVGLKPVSPHGTTVDMIRVEAATTVVAVGDPVVIDGSGQATIITAATDVIYGVAAEPGSFTAGDTMLVWPAQAGMRWEGQAAGTPTQAQIGDQVDFSVFTTGGMQIDTSSNVNGQLTFISKRDFDDALAANLDILVTINSDFNGFEGT